MGEEKGTFRCPICGRTDAVRQDYNARRKVLRVSHADAKRCTATGVDEWGRATP